MFKISNIQRLFLIVILLGTVNSILATHNRAGEITYTHLGGFQYEITVTTYTKASSCPADRCTIEIKFGDGDIDTIIRNNPNGLPCPSSGVNCDQSQEPSCNNCGYLIPGTNIKMNIYRTTHTYSGSGIFTISVNDPNRNGDIWNIPNSEQTTFFIESELIIGPATGSNSSPVLTYPPIDNGCVGLPFVHNPGAVDPDGDSLVYSLVNCLGNNGGPIAGYVPPNQSPGGCASGSLSIDSQTGTLIWDAAICQGEYNVCILIEEYRFGYYIGSIRRDMQITIIAPCPNDPPDIVAVNDTCIIAGQVLNQQIEVSDLNSGDVITLTGTGSALSTSNPAIFRDTSGVSILTQNFSWQTNCENIKLSPYQVTFRAEDDNPFVQLVDFETFDITVIGPAPQNPAATPNGNAIELNWDPYLCTNATGFKVYRKLDSISFNPTYCQTGVPSTTGYTQIGTVAGGASTSYTDNNIGGGLIHGQKYCYMVVACFGDGAESVASEQFCAELNKDLPIITHVSVGVTAITSGIDTITWSMPTELDTINNPKFQGPWQYRIYRDQGFNQATSPIGTTSIQPYLSATDTIFIDSGLNTENSAYTYRVELFSNDTLVGTTHTASSIRLSAVPSDNKITLSWTETVPWTNYMYYVYRKNDLTLLWDFLGSISTPSYVDQGLINGKEYTYHVKSFGAYPTTGIVDPIINYSQEIQAIPTDDVAPCAPEILKLESDCKNNFNRLQWNNPNNSCADDVMGYNIYYTPKFGDSLELVYTINNANLLWYQHADLLSVAGCYAITAFDSAQYGNESTRSDTVCVENCPYYRLPSVFSPGIDGYNDTFHPFPYRFVHSIDLSIYNRWGQVVFRSTDPDISWSGKHKDTNTLCSDGVYFYVCKVFEYRLHGLTPRLLKGYVHLISERQSGTPNTN